MTAASCRVAAEQYVGFRSGAAGRDLAAYLCRRYTRATWRELAKRFGLSHPDSASELIRRATNQVEQSREAARHQKSIETKLGLNPEARV